jgi:type IV pilus assembly protein PilC
VAEFQLRYADPRGRIHEQIAEAGSEREARERLTQQGYLVYSVKTRDFGARFGGLGRRKKTVGLEKFLIFNQQLVTLIRAGLPILKGLDLLADRLTDPKLARYVKGVRDDVKEGAMLSEAFARQGVFPPIYITTILAGEKSGALVEVLERYLGYQKQTLAVRKKVMVSLLYPAVLIVLVVCLIVFLVTFVVPNFAVLYSSMQAQLPAPTRILIAVGTTARKYIIVGALAFFAAIIGFFLWSRQESSRETLDNLKRRLPLFGEIWLKYQVAQFSRVLSTLLVGGIPLTQALDTSGKSTGTVLLKKALDRSLTLIREGKPLSQSLASTHIFPALAVDMMEVGESTGALPQMLNSVAEFYDQDVSTRTTAVLSLVEPAIMIFMGIFVAFVLVALYLPIFSLASSGSLK